eukprot:2079306-Pleurochrysis_carterae.AAC.1
MYEDDLGIAGVKAQMRQDCKPKPHETLRRLAAQERAHSRKKATHHYGGAQHRHSYSEYAPLRLKWPVQYLRCQKQHSCMQRASEVDTDKTKAGDLIRQAHAGTSGNRVSEKVKHVGVALAKTKGGRV